MKYVIAIVVMLLPSVVMAAPDVKISISAEKEVVVMENGKQVRKLVEAKTSMPGDIIFYALHFENVGDEVATNVDLVDPVPSGMTYVNGSAYGPGSEITFSIDQGRNYKKPSLLTYEVSGEKRTASPDQYSHIRWLLKNLEPGQSGTAGFQARVK